MALEVIGAGFGRTGTLSLKVALETLGFGPCYHMTEFFEHPGHVPLWEAADRGEAVDWEGIFGDYRATTDWPAAAFYERLAQRYPEAKVILTTRAPESWYESARDTIFAAQGMADSPLFAVVGLFVPRLRNVRRAVRLVDDLAWRGSFGGRFEDRDHAIAVFEAGNEEVKERIPAERLLVYEVSEGWDPLCAFLGVEEPDEPFPRLNDKAVFQGRIRRGRALSVIVPGVAVLLGALSLLLYRRRVRR
jgi:hypothetical protein